MTDSTTAGGAGAPAQGDAPQAPGGMQAGKFGKHGRKPGWGNGGFGPPGQLKKQGGGAGKGGAQDGAGAIGTRPGQTAGGGEPCPHHPGMVHPVQTTTTAPAAERERSTSSSQPARPRTEVANASGRGAATQGGSIGDAVLLAAVGDTYRPQQAQPTRNVQPDDTLRRQVQLPAVDGLQLTLETQPTRA